MPKITASAAGEAMPANNPIAEIADTLDMAKSLANAAYMASSDLQDFQRDALRSLLDTIVDKIEHAAKVFEANFAATVGAEADAAI